MVEISLRDFIRKPTQYLLKLKTDSIALTQYNRIVAYLVKSVDRSVNIPDSQVEKAQNTRYGYCEGHFEKGVQCQLKEVKWVDAEGETFGPKWLCEACIRKLEAGVRKNGGKITYK